MKTEIHKTKTSKYFGPSLKEKKYLPSMDKEEDDEDNQSGYVNFYQSKQEATKITLVLDEPIREPKYYRNVIQRVQSLGEGDVFEIDVDSYGGSLDGAIAILNAMDNTDANVVVNHKGAAASAASLIVLNAPSVYVSPYASMMLHQGSFGTWGKQSDVLGFAHFVDVQIRAITQKIYKNFISEQELNDIFVGKEMWMHYDEIITRLENRQKLMELDHEADDDEGRGEAEDVLPELEFNNKELQAKPKSRTSRNKTQAVTNP